MLRAIGRVGLILAVAAGGSARGRAGMRPRPRLGELPLQGNVVAGFPLPAERAVQE